MMSKDCIFCKLVAGEIKTDKVMETDDVVAVCDINPVAQTHIVIMPKKHIESVLTVSSGDAAGIIAMFRAAQKIVREKNLEAFRLAINGGRYQHVPHLHMHLLAGGSVRWNQL
ncbi:HIT domain-containing protein [Candidatus Curtissbacteria bacterium]|nr:HIT domain-containing protein [Candidatus Curtissbacteria bacterium]